MKVNKNQIFLMNVVVRANFFQRMLKVIWIEMNDCIFNVVS